MGNITISEEKLNKIVNDVEILITDVVSLIDQDEIVKKRMLEIKKDPSITKSETELDEYLKKKGIKIE